MHYFSVNQALVLGLLASAPLAAGLTAEAGVHDVERRHIVRKALVFLAEMCC